MSFELTQPQSGTKPKEIRICYACKHPIEEGQWSSGRFIRDGFYICHCHCPDKEPDKKTIWTGRYSHDTNKFERKIKKIRKLIKEKGFSVSGEDYPDHDRPYVIEVAELEKVIKGNEL